jgi:hypothetical protein
MTQPFFKTASRNYAMIALFAFVAVLPIAFQGMPGGNDTTQHYEFAQHIYESLRQGSIYPSFAGNANHGFGDVGLRFYPPLSYYVLVMLYTVSGDWFFASFAMFFLVFLAGGLGIFLWAKEGFEGQIPLAAAAIYTFAPYHLNEIYNNFLFAEFAATAVLPFCFLFVTRVCRNSSKLAWIGLAVTYSLLILTHLPLTILGSIALAIYALVNLRTAVVAAILRLAAAVTCGLVLSSFYWVRMVTEMDWLKHSHKEYFSDIWSYRENYLLLPSHFSNYAEDTLSLWLGDLMLIAMIMIAIPTVILTLTKSIERSAMLTGIGVGLVIAILMTTTLTSFIWDNFSILQKVQFPWRWVGIVSIFGSVFAAVGLVKSAEILKSSKNVMLPVGIGFVLLVFVTVSAFILKAPHYTSRSNFNTYAAGLSSGETFEGWWPVWAKRTAFSQKERVAANERIASVTEWNSDRRIFEVTPGPAQQISVATFYYPHWHATVNAKSVPVEVNELGMAAINIPAESSTAVLTFEEARSVRIAYWISAFSWLIIVALYFTAAARS